MATPFSYANTITAATPAVAAEVQGNFDDLLDWIDAYYQQTLDTTAEIAAAIAAAPSVSVLALEDCTAGVSAGSITLGTKFEIPGMSATWTADASHLYRIDASARWNYSGGTQGHRHSIYTSTTTAPSGDDVILSEYGSIGAAVGAALDGGAVFTTTGFCVLSGLSGSVTRKIYGLVQDGSTHNSGTLQ